jgi:hypothetical protein
MIALTLRCDECGATETPRLFSRWAPYGVLEIRGATRFYVDGEQVRCPQHAQPGRERQQRAGFHVREYEEARRA